MSSRQVTSGLRPPCTHRNCWLRRAARGRQSNASIQASYTCSEYFILPGRRRQKVRYEVVDFKKGTSLRRGATGLTLLFEGEVLCEVPAFVVASEEEQGVGMVDLQSPQVQYTLQRNKHTHKHTVVRNESSALLLQSNAKNLSHGL